MAALEQCSNGGRKAIAVVAAARATGMVLIGCGHRPNRGIVETVAGENLVSP